MALAVNGLEKALIRYLATQGIAAVEINSIDDQAYEQSGCPTCYGGLEYEVDIWYQPTTEGRQQLYTYKGKFADLLYYLTDEEPSDG